jgi:uncharacterized protein
MLIQSWISPKTQKGLPSKIDGKGIFAKEPIAKGEVVFIRSGHIIDRQTLESNRNIIKDSEAAITDDLYLAPLTDAELPRVMVYANHSCDPNAGTQSNIVWVALRDIKPGEEITLDYATHFAQSDYVMVCNCGAPCCRGKITGNDWQNPEFQKKYAGYFAWYIQQKIDAQTNRT